MHTPEQRVELEMEPTVISSPKPPSVAESKSVDQEAQAVPATAPAQSSIKAAGLGLWAVMAACCVSACIGMGIAWMLLPLAANSDEVVSINAEPLYLASTVRRTEPIAPILPFTDLNPAVVALGSRLFHDTKLSSTGRLACASCHDLDQGGDDGRPLAVGIKEQPLSRNTPTIFNAALNFAQGWDASAESLEDQLDEHFASPAVMGSDWERVVLAVSQDPFYNRSFQLALGAEPDQQLIRQALATYQRSLLTVDSKFDQWLRGDEQALDGNQVAGYYLFKKYNCTSCHQGEAVGAKMVQQLDKMRDYFRDIDAPLPTGLVQLRVPSLRNVALTAPYFHDGSAQTLEDAVQAMLRYQAGFEPKPLDVQRISAFLMTLTGELPATGVTKIP